MTDLSYFESFWCYRNAEKYNLCITSMMILGFVNNVGVISGHVGN